MGVSPPATGGFTLRTLPMSARLVLSVFLISVGFGYFSALVQLHFQQAAAGEPLPGPNEVQDTYAGKANKGQLERLITADELKPFNGSGSMRSAFTFRSAGWKSQVRQRAQAKNIPSEEAEQQLRKLREYEITVLLGWIHAGAKKENFGDFVIADEFFKDLPAGEEPDSHYFQKNAAGKWTAKISNIFEDRCARCHAPGKPGAEGQIHLDTWKNVVDYVHPERGGMSLTKLAQTTHVHLLGFSMLYGLTGVIFAFTSYPLVLRCLIAPLALAAQVGEISCWWLSRSNPVFAFGIMGLGGIVALTVGAQIILSLFDMYGRGGRLVIGLLMLATMGLGGFLHINVIDPHLKEERKRPTEFLPTEPGTDKTETRPQTQLGQLERLITADENKPFNGAGSMRAAFTFKSSGWKRQVRDLVEKKKLTEGEADRQLRQQRDYEVGAIVAWLHAGAKKDGYELFVLPADFAKGESQLNEDFFAMKDGRWTAKISSIIDVRCCRCHADGKGGPAGQIHLDSYVNLMDYVPPER